MPETAPGSLVQKTALLAVALPEDIEKAKWSGDFARCERLIEARIRDERTPGFMKERLSLEKEIVRRLPLNYAYTVEEGLRVIREEIPSFTREELERRIDSGSVDFIYVHGVLHLATRFYSAMVDTDPDIARRAGKFGPAADETAHSAGKPDLTLGSNSDFEGTSIGRMKNDIVAKLQEKGEITCRIRMRHTLSVKEAHFKAGRHLVHLPIPRPQDNISAIRVLKIDPPTGKAGLEDEKQRTVSFQEILRENHPFSVEYEYDCTARYIDLEPYVEGKKSAPPQTPVWSLEEPAEEDFCEVLPHIVFSPVLKELQKECAGDLLSEEKSPLRDLRIARRFYDFITTKVKYSYMRDYFTMERGAEYGAAALLGDCGIQALLFITLCRMSGIAAAWQSGQYVTPAYGGSEAEAGGHDWARFYIEGFGWLFADLSFGGSAYRAKNFSRWNHYFGNLDPYRMAANSAYMAPLYPEKRFLRNDPYDNQSGEAENEAGPLTYDMLSIRKEVLSHNMV